MGSALESRLFAAALGPSGSDANRQAQDLLRSAYLQTRERASLLAQDIAVSLPEFTVHDESHLDALWEMADLVAGDEIALNGAEAYVLGIAILLHDLGLAIASYPAGPSELHAEPMWSDTLIRLLRARLGRLPTDEEVKNAPGGLRSAAEKALLRTLHAKHAEKLASISWSHDGTEYWLIEERELREAYGPLIGRLAHSHWWPTDRLTAEFGTSMGSSPLVPKDWIVDPLKLACLLRAADAVHLDTRRAPPFLRALRRPQGEASDHWSFQGRLNRPYLDGDRLTFTASAAFPSADARAWWLCRDVLGRVDEWLREIDALLADLGHHRLAARSVSAADDPKRLAQLIPTSGWVPINASLHVSNVADLVRRLGGEQLYGRDANVPLRELIQNSADAVRARRVLQRKEQDWGAVEVTLTNRDDAWFLTVSDSGVGMSDSVLSEALVDFGSSFWSSDQIGDEFPGLLAGGFSPTGQYGVGFFSVFMLGDSVTVVTRPYKGGVEATRVLEFRGGLGERPLLREAQQDEVLEDGGTSVTIRLRESPNGPDGLLSRGSSSNWSLRDLCAWLCPTLDVDVTVSADGERAKIITANDWLVISPLELRIRLGRGKQTEKDDLLVKLDDCLRPMYGPGEEVVGRAVIKLARHDYGFEARTPAWPGVVSIGGLRSTRLSSLGGILVGRSERAARDVGIPVVTEAELRRWSTEQASLIYELGLDPETQKEAASVVATCGGDTQDLKVAELRSGWVTLDELIPWAENLDRIVLVQDAAISNLMVREHPGLLLLENVVVTDPGWPGMLDTPHGTYVPWPSLYGGGPGQRGSLADFVIRLTASAWGIDLSDLVQASSFSTDDVVFSEEVGEENGKAISVRHLDVLRRPALADTNRVP
jgi:Histidine kinase-, DNA gyrase B-, and HSP90-like ATPase